jgi:hypothetical protein
MATNPKPKEQLPVRRPTREHPQDLKDRMLKHVGFLKLPIRLMKKAGLSVNPWQIAAN